VEGVRIAKLREIRLRRLMSQRDLARAAGTTEDTISQLENGRRSARPSTVRRLAVALDATAEELGAAPDPAAVES
jgi:transcriptional regulator with XRE-family HTH domain